VRILVVCRGCDAAQIELAQAMQVTKGAMSNTVARLLDTGYITVQADPNDCHAMRVGLGAEGRRARDRAVDKLDRALDGGVAVMSAREVGHTLESKRKLRVWFDKQRRPPPSDLRRQGATPSIEPASPSPTSLEDQQLDSPARNPLI